MLLTAPAVRRYSVLALRFADGRWWAEGAPVAYRVPYRREIRSKPDCRKTRPYRSSSSIYYLSKEFSTTLAGFTHAAFSAPGSRIGRTDIAENLFA